jgi:hypothetical protein
MGYVPGFNNDIFISYSHIDDQAVEGPGWVTDFHRRLAIEVEEELGERVKIWRDKRITGATDFTRDMENQVRGSAILLAVLSPAYVNSKWCDWELTGFAGSRRVGDLWVDTKCRAIKVIKRPADVSRLRVLLETQGVKFYDVDPATDVPYEMRWSSDLYKQRLTALGNDIGFILRAMRKARTVFLGMASEPLWHQRRALSEELKGRGYCILTSLKDDWDNDQEKITRQAIRESALSVLFYDRAASNVESREKSAALERRVAIEEQARQIIVVHGNSSSALEPWDESAATGSAKIEWLIEPHAHRLYQTVLQMLDFADSTEHVPPTPVQPYAATGVPFTPIEGAGSRKAERTPPELPSLASTLSSTVSEAGRLFICYRRDDTEGEAGRLHDGLSATFGVDAIIMDVDSVPLGMDYVDHISEQIGCCKAVVVMIGRQWLVTQDKKGRRRLDDPEDLVRMEIAAALKRKVPVIPVLVQNATMPDREDLPDEIRLLTRRNGVTLRHDQWRDGVERLVTALKMVIGRAAE